MDKDQEVVRRFPKLREAERTNASCRGCDKLVSKGSLGVFWHSYANRGMNIILCVDCCKYIGSLVEGV